MSTPATTIDADGGLPSPSSSAAPLLSPTATPSSSEASLDQPSLADILRAVYAVQAQVRETKADLQEQKADMQQTKEQLAKLKTATRRQTRVVPPSTPFASPRTPSVSSTTHSTYQQLETPSGERVKQGTRLSLSGGVVATSEDDSDDDGEEKETTTATPAGRTPMADEEVDAKDADRLAKIMSKMDRPVKFSGEKEKEQEEVESWADDVSNYLASQFGTLQGRYPAFEWTLLLSLLTGTARQWVEGERGLNRWTSWEALKPRFIVFISGGRESRTLHLEQMKALVYGKGKCKDLLSLEREFERLRVKLYPSSSTSPEMNEVVGRWYSEIIERGDVDLYAEMLRGIGAKQQPTLSDWKTAAVNALRIREILAPSRRASQLAGRGRDFYRSQGQARTSTTSVNAVDGGEDEEGQGETTDLDGEAAQIEGRPKSSRPSRPPGKAGFRLPDEVYRRVMEKKLCLQCYRPGHRIGEAACKEKGQNKRMPTEQELKA